MLQETCYLNVDLDIHSRSDLQPLVSALGTKVTALWVGRLKRTYRAHLEIAKLTTTADATILAFCRLIQALPPAGRAYWDQAKLRQFSIGIQAGVQPNSYEFPIHPATVKSVAGIGASISICVYGAGMKRAGPDHTV